MRRGAFIISLSLFALMIWRGPTIVYHPSGAMFVPDIRYNFENAFTWATTLALVYYICANVNAWVGAFLGLAAFSAWYPINTSVSELTYKFVLSGVLWYCVCFHIMRNEKATRTILNMLCVIVLINCVFIISQGVFEYDPIHYSLKPLHESTPFDRVANTGLMSCVNGASALLAITFPLFFRKWWAWGLVAVIPCFILVHTFGGPLAVASGAVLFALVLLKERVYKLLVILVILLSVAGYSHFIDKPDPGWRYKVWKSAITKTMPQKPWFGSGLGHWKLHYSRKVITRHTLDQYFMQAHNEFIQARFEMGFFAGVLILGYLATTFIKGFKMLTIEWDHCLAMGLFSLIAICVTSSVFFTFHIAIIAGAALTIMAMIQARLKHVYSSKGSEKRFSDSLLHIVDSSRFLYRRLFSS